MYSETKYCTYLQIYSVHIVCNCSNIFSHLVIIKIFHNISNVLFEFLIEPSFSILGNWKIVN